MRLERLVARRLGPFRDEVTLDLEALDGARLVAVVGPNGAGKSTALELFPGAIYRSCPTRGDLRGLSIDRNAYVEATIVNGRRWTIRQNVDAISGKGEAVVLDEAGQPVMESTKVRAYDAWARDHLPPPEVLYASTFCPQGSGGFLELTPGARKACLLRILGIERLERMAELARERQRVAEREVARLRGALEQALLGADVASAERELADAQADVTAAAEVLDRAMEELRDARDLAAQAEEAARQAKDRAALQHRRDEAAGRVTDLERRAANNRQLLDRAEEVRVAVERARVLDEQLDELVQRQRELVAERDRLLTDTARAKAAAQAATVRRQRGERRVDTATTRIAGLTQIEAAEEAVRIAEEAVGASEGELDEQRTKLADARAWQLSGADNRIQQLRGGLDGVVGSQDLWEARRAAESSLAVDDKLAGKLLALPDQVAAQEADLRLREARHGELVTSLQAARLDLDRSRREMPRAQEERTAGLQEVEEAIRDLEAALAEQTQADTRCTIVQVELGDVAPAIETLKGERSELQATVALAEPLARAEARLGELAPALDQARRDVQVLDQELASLPTADPIPYVPDVDAAERAVARAQAGHAAALSHVAVAERDLNRARETAERLQGQEASLRAAEEDLADWTRLALDLGRDGVQALQVDAAGPELTELVNDLLWNCVSRRWTVSIETTRPSADGKKEIEGCDVKVLDTERGRDAPVETFSGGERVLLGEAVSLALTTLACRRAGIEGATLVRDESGAALDPTNGRAYIAMLRRAADLVGADKVLFVSHTPELQELADARIRIEDGRLEVLQ